jgi:hypothetical protein
MVQAVCGPRTAGSWRVRINLNRNLVRSQSRPAWRARAAAGTLVLLIGCTKAPPAAVARRRWLRLSPL